MHRRRAAAGQRTERSSSFFLVLCVLAFSLPFGCETASGPIPRLKTAPRPWAASPAQAASPAPPRFDETNPAARRERPRGILSEVTGIGPSSTWSDVARVPGARYRPLVRAAPSGGRRATPAAARRPTGRAEAQPAGPADSTHAPEPARTPRAEFPPEAFTAEESTPPEENPPPVEDLPPVGELPLPDRPLEGDEAPIEVLEPEDIPLELEEPPSASASAR